MLLGKANQGLTSLNLSNDCWKIRESVEAKVRTFGSIDDVLLEEEAAEDERRICVLSALQGRAKQGGDWHRPLHHGAP